MKWKRAETRTQIYVTEENGGFRIEPGWRWSDRRGKRVRDGWEAYAGFGPSRRFLGARDKLREAKALCEGAIP